MTRSKRSAPTWSRLLDAMDRRSRKLYAEAVEDLVTPLLLRRPICQILGGHDWEKRDRPPGYQGEVVSIDEGPNGPTVTIEWGSDPYFECRRCGFRSDTPDEEDRPPTPNVLRGLDALMWWIEHRHEQNGWHWLPRRAEMNATSEENR